MRTVLFFLLLLPIYEIIQTATAKSLVFHVPSPFLPCTIDRSCVPNEYRFFCVLGSPMATNVMPIKIFIAKTRFFSEDGRYYTRTGQPLIPMTDVTDIMKAPGIEMDDQIYCELMSIQNTADAERFTKSYPFLRVAYHSHPAFKINELDTAARYHEGIVWAVSRFHDIRLFLAQLRAYLRLREKEGEGAAFESSERKDVIGTYSKLFRILNRNSAWTSVYDMESDYYDLDDKVDEVSEAFMAQKPGMELSYQDLMDDYFEGRDELRIQHEAAVQQQVNEVVDARMFEDIAIYVTTITSRATVTFDPRSYTMVCKCPDLLTAMYLMAFVADFNTDDYKLCAHPGCHTYFKVDKTHPQSMCDRHMEARRRKRENQKRKGGTDYSKEAKASDFEG